MTQSISSPSTTESATNRIDLDSLSAALMKAGGIRHILWSDYIHIASPMGIDVYPDGTVFVGTTLLDSADMHALDIIREHTAHTPARSHVAREEAVVRVAFTVDDAMMASNACRNCGEHAIAEVLDVLIHDALSTRTHAAGTPGEGS